MKVCAKCHKELSIDDFYKRKNRRAGNGIASYCKKCSCLVRKLSYEKNKDKIRESRRIWRLENKEKIHIQNTISYQKNRLERIARQQEYTRLNFDKVAEYNKLWQRKQRDTNIHYKLSKNFSRGIAHSLLTGKGGRKWESLVGYSIEDLKRHLESLFTDGMSWDNYGKWHIDHIKPKILFEYKDYDDEQFILCWSLSNLQPLWAKDNLIKGKKYDRY